MAGSAPESRTRRRCRSTPRRPASSSAPRVHVARAGARKNGGQAIGYLGVRLRAVRDADRQARIPRRRCHRHDRVGGEQGARLERVAAETSRRHPQAVAAVPREGSEARLDSAAAVRLEIDEDRPHLTSTHVRRRAQSRRTNAVNSLDATGCRGPSPQSRSRWLSPRSPSRICVHVPQAGAMVRFTVAAPFGVIRDDGPAFAVSPDGQTIAFRANGAGGVGRLFTRRLDQPDAQPVAGTDNAGLPFWSPDSRSLGFSKEGGLYRTELDGSAPRRLCDEPGTGGRQPGFLVVRHLGRERRHRLRVHRRGAVSGARHRRHAGGGDFARRGEQRGPACVAVVSAGWPPCTLPWPRRRADQGRDLGRLD